MVQFGIAALLHLPGTKLRYCLLEGEKNETRNSASKHAERTFDSRVNRADESGIMVDML